MVDLKPVFLLSPANCGGIKARRLMAPGAAGELASRLRSPDGVPVGELFTYLSSLYFRGKLSYARAFGSPPSRLAANGQRTPPDPDLAALVITPCQGLLPAFAPLHLDDLEAYAVVQVDPRDDRYREPLDASLRELAAQLGRRQPLVLLGSVASPKYISLLTARFGSRLLFPATFAGRGDMSRGGLLLRQVAAGVQLDYVPVVGAALHGERPPKLPRLLTSRTPR